MVGRTRPSFGRISRLGVALLALAGLCAVGSASVQGQPAPQTQPVADSADASTALPDASPSTTPVPVRGTTFEAQLRKRAQSRPSNDTSDTPSASGGPEGVSIGGLVINDTRTTIGRDFYDVFYSRWETPKGAENVMIRVYEQPRPNLGTRIVVDVEDRTVFRANLRPRFEQIKKAARAALARAHRYVKKRYEPRTRY